MRSRSRSPKQWRTGSRERRVAGYGRIINERRNLKRMRSRSPIGKGYIPKGRSVSRSITPKRRRNSLNDEHKSAKHIDSPCKREADSTNMSQKHLTRDPITQNRSHIGSFGNRSIGDNRAHKVQSHIRSNSGRQGRNSPHVSNRSHHRDRERRTSNSKERTEKPNKSQNESLEDSKHSKKPSHDDTNDAKSSGKSKVFDQTDITLDERFIRITGFVKEIVLEENVSIEIERAIEGRAVPFEMPVFWSDAVVLVRRPDEGKKPLSDRTEFNYRKDEYEEERRTVKVKKTSAHNDADRRDDRRDSEKRREERHRREHIGRSSPTRRRDSKPFRLEDERSILKNARDLLISMQSRDDEGGSKRPGKRSVISASNVSKQYLLPAAAVITGELPFHTATQANRREKESGKSSRIGTIAGRYMAAASVAPPALPDFAHRPDKYKYEEWKDRPELIPKGRSYFEHDDRGVGNDSWNSRGFRGRGRGRGGFSRPQGGSRSSTSAMDVWTHDKFEELSDGQRHQQPSSTT